MFFNGIGIGFEKIWYQKSIGIGFVKFWYRKKYRYRYWKKIGIEKSIGFGIGKNWYRKKFRIRFRSDFWYRHTLPASLFHFTFFKTCFYLFWLEGSRRRVRVVRPPASLFLSVVSAELESYALK